MYPGETGQGFAYPVKPGVNIIVGVNGLGKTTLLNLLMRMVAGPEQIPATAGLGMGARSESRSNPRFFSARVKDAAASASATAILGFGEKRLTVTRKLSNLEITYLKIETIEVKGSRPEEYEERFKAGVLQLSGLQQFYDYLLLIQFVFFSLEDRQALIWDEDAQSEILRVLYYDPSQHIAYRALYNKIAQLDSEIRNTQAVLSRHEKKLGAELAKRLDDTSARELKTLRKTLAELGEAINASEDQAEELNSTRMNYRDQLEFLKVSHEDKISKARAANEEYLRLEFSEAENEALYAVASVIGERGCIFCGSKASRAKQAVMQRLKKHHCPLCDADAKERENSTVGGDKAPLIESATRLEIDATKSAEMIASLEKLMDEASEKYEASMHALVNQRKQHQEINLQVKIFENGIPKDDDSFKDLQEKLLGVRDLIDYSKQEKSEAEIGIDAIISPGEARVAKVAKAIISRFQEYITGFMAETCVLQYEVREKRIGQGPSAVKFRFPAFSVRVTSGVFNDEASSRLTQNDVSESQREFIDLAFRMSLISEITAHSAAMLVVETPEASLDSVFVPRAGHMVRKFLEASSVLKNVLIASTNLNRELMIPALFGVIAEADALQFAKDDNRQKFDDRVAEALPSSERVNRIVNLLKIAAKNAALTKYGSEYQHEYANAVFPPWENFEVARELSK
jgi:hypothetical protein